MFFQLYNQSNNSWNTKNVTLHGVAYLSVAVWRNLGSLPEPWGRERVGRWGNSTAMRRLPLKRLIHARCPTVRETSRQQDFTVPPLPASTPEERRRARTGRRNGGLRKKKKKKDNSTGRRCSLAAVTPVSRWQNIEASPGPSVDWISR